MSYGGKIGRSGEESGAGGGAERATETKYEQMYENELDPFKEFDSRELVFFSFGHVRRTFQGFLPTNEPPLGWLLLVDFLCHFSTVVFDSSILAIHQPSDPRLLRFRLVVFCRRARQLSVCCFRAFSCVQRSTKEAYFDDGRKERHSCTYIRVAC